jgi:hypothetical protein
MGNSFRSETRYAIGISVISDNLTISRDNLTAAKYHRLHLTPLWDSLYIDATGEIKMKKTVTYSFGLEFALVGVIPTTLRRACKGGTVDV